MLGKRHAKLDGTLLSMPWIGCNAVLPGTSYGCKAACACSRCVCCPSSACADTTLLRGRIWEPKRVRWCSCPSAEGFGLCGTVPSLLFLNAWSEERSRKADFLMASHEDVSTSLSRINSYTMSVLQAASLPSCWGPLLDLRATLAFSVAPASAVFAGGNTAGAPEAMGWVTSWVHSRGCS